MIDAEAEEDMSASRRRYGLLAGARAFGREIADVEDAVLLAKALGLFALTGVAVIAASALVATAVKVFVLIS